MRRLQLIAAMIAIAGLALLPAVALADEHEPDGRARVSFVEGMIDAGGELWLKVGFDEPWDEKPPDDLFSFFFLLFFELNGEPAAGTGWQIHEGVPEYLGEPGQEAYILDNGCVIVSTGLFPTGDFSLDVQASFGSWLFDAAAAVFGDTSMGTSSEFVDTGDPFTDFGGTAVYDLATQKMLAVTTTTTTTTSTTTTTTTTVAVTETTEPAATTTTAAPDPGTGDPDFGPHVAVVFFLVALAFAIVLLVGWFFGWWLLPWLGPFFGEYGPQVRRRLGGDRPTPTPPEPEDDREGPGTGTSRPRETGTSGTETGTSGTRTTGTSGTAEAGDGSDEPEVFDEREPEKPDCTPLRLECERLKEAAAAARIAADSAENRAADAEAECERARQRIADLEAKVADLEEREDAPQRYLRLAEAMQALGDARAGIDEICGAVDSLRAEAAERRSEAERLEAEAAEACRKAEECEAQQ